MNSGFQQHGTPAGKQSSKTKNAESAESTESVESAESALSSESAKPVESSESAAQSKHALSGVAAAAFRRTASPAICPQPANRSVPQASVPQSNVQSQAPRNDRPNRKWENRMVKIEETFDDIRKDNERIEKEIWLEIAEIHNAKLD